MIMYAVFCLFFLMIWIRVEQRQLYNATFYNAIKSKKYEIMQERFVLILSLFGLNLFLMLWEVHYRYTVNYYPVLLVIAVFGLTNLSSIWNRFIKLLKICIREHL